MTQPVENPVTLLPLLRGVIFPHTTTAIPVGRPRTIELVRDLRPGELVVVGVQLSPETQDPTQDDLYPVATLAKVQQVVRMAGGGFRIVLQGLRRVRIDSMAQSLPYWTVNVSEIEEVITSPEEVLELTAQLGEALQELSAQTGANLTGLASQYAHEPASFADRVAADMGLETEQRAEILGILDVNTRLERVLELVSEILTRSEVKQTIERNVRKEFGKNQREAILREQLKAIRQELGDDGKEDSDSLRDRLEAKMLPEEVRTIAERELTRMETMNPAQAEYGVIRNYLDWILELPWMESAESEIDLDEVATRLDTDHHALHDVKQRILEHMAVISMTGNPQGTILCLAGPPGVGKTSLAQSVADAIDRPLLRISLGGVRDEAEIRGHRRTYVGALPGRLINAMRKAGKNNPVLVLDEIDKLGNSWMGSPDAALLEVLDPEQNVNFTDHYLELPFDLSKVLFICTANDLSKLSGPLRDRLEIIDVSGYTPDEKIQIAREHLLPKQLEKHGLPEDAVELTDSALRSIVLDYTREAGVRQLGRQLTKLCRTLTLEIARGQAQEGTVQIDEADVSKYLGKTRFFSDVAERTAIPGVATGLAWTPMGGDILFIETTAMQGKGRMEVTGQLGDVMKESCRAALAYLRTHASGLGIERSAFEEQDIHLHIPAGAVPKDGPSAGVTIFTALTSLLTGRRVRPDTAMTGECSLRGRVLPVGGIKSKVLAAHRAGIKRVILPEKNRRDIDDVPQNALDELEVIFVSEMGEALAAALEDEQDTLPIDAGTESSTEDASAHA